MNRIKYLLILAFWQLISILSFAQQGQTDPYTPKIIPPSPNAASITKYSDIPVNQYTGSAQVTVPIYTIQSGDITVPINLSSGTTGIRLSEESGWVGLGWALNAGGVINRTMMDKDDFDQDKYFNTSVPEIDGKPLSHFNFNAPTSPYFYDFYCDYNVVTDKGTSNFHDPILYYQDWDFEADIYSFNFGNYSGKFFIKRNREVVLSKQENLKIEFNTNGTVFTITDDKGFKYIFSDVEYQKTNTDSRTHVSAWYLSRIVSPKNQVVTFTYTNPNTWSYGLEGTSQTFRFGCNSNNGLISNTIPANEYLNITLKSIQYNNGKVDFDFDYDRVDLFKAPKLNKIKIYNKVNGNYNELFSHRFYYSYFNNDVSGNDPEYKRLKLDSVKQWGSSGWIPPYKFTYFDAVGNAGKSSYSLDYWGYYNGAPNSVYLVPSFYGYYHSGAFGQLDGANRKPNPDYSKKFTIQSIRYPTGGKTVFDLEGNDFDENKSRPWETSFEETNFQDFQSESLVSARGTTNGNVDLSNRYGPVVSYSLAFRCSTPEAATLLHGNSGLINVTLFGTTIDIASNSLTLQGNSVWTTGEVQINQPSNTTYNWSAFISPTIGTDQFQDIRIIIKWKELERDHNGSITCGGLRVKSITDYDGFGTAVKKRNYEYNYFEDKNNDGTAEKYSYGKRLAPLNFTRTEMLWEDIPIAPGGDGGGRQRCYSTTRYSSSITPASATSSGNIIGYSQVIEYQVDPFNETNTLGKTVYQFLNEIDTVINDTEYRLPGLPNIGVAKNGLLTTKTEYRSNSGSFNKISETNNYYSSTNRKLVYNLKLDNVEGGLPKLNSGCPPGSPLTEVEYLGFLFPAIQSEKILLDSTRQTTYDQFDQNKASSVVTTNYYDNPVHYQLTRSSSKDSKGNKRISFIKYPQDFISAGNTTGNTVLDAMINSNMVAASIEKRDSLFYNGSSTGVLTASQVSLSRLVNNYILGDKQYKLDVAAPITNYQPVAIAAGNIVLDNRMRSMINMDQYDNANNLVQYQTTDGIINTIIWGYNSEYPVAKIIGVPYNTVTSTVALNQTIIQNPASDNALRTELNRIRTAFPNNMVTTYTYIPTVGMSSETDVNGRTSFYEYDHYGRLWLIRDKDMNILKKFCYNYAGQLEDCGINSDPKWQDTDSTRCKPCSINPNYKSKAKEKEQMDINRESISYKIRRWLDAGISDCEVSVWENTTSALRCRVVNGANTGEQEQEQKDINPCSDTYNQTRWVVAGMNCTSCATPAKWQSTGNTRCFKDANNNNTGYQEIEQKDTASCSSTFNLTRWVNNGINCTSCPTPASWSPTGNTRCVLDANSNNTGYQEREERDTVSCSSTFNQTRWVSAGLNCTSCPKPGVWIPTGNTRCLKDAGNNNTGYQEREERDTVSCSNTYNQLRWVNAGLNCTSCPKPANWVATGNTRCVKDINNNNTGYQEREERDTVSCSSTYNQTRWVNAGLNCTTCPKPPVFVPTGNTRCATDGYGNNTGYLQREERDTVSCSSTYNLTRWVTTVKSCSTCPTPSNWVPTGRYRCVTDQYGNNTSVREQEETDAAECSATYSQLRWVSLGTNCVICPKPGIWQFVSSRCELDAQGYNTGNKIITERDIETCSATYNTTRERLQQDCTTCPKQPKWVIYSSYCEVDAANKNTGNLVVYERDEEYCSTTYNQTRQRSYQDCSTCPKPQNWQVVSASCEVVNGSRTSYKIVTEQNIEPCSINGGGTRTSRVLDCPNCGSPTAVWQPTGNYRCGRDGNGVLNNTQEREEKDVNICSSTYNQLRWVFNASKPANWQVISTACETSAGINTGYQVITEQDIEPCSATYGQTRSTSTLLCSSCPTPTKWQATGNYRCVKDGTGKNTGEQEREERDNSTCSPTSTQLRWVSNGTNCTSCPKDPVWTPTGNTRCLKDESNNNTGYQEREEQNTESCSPGYLSIRWVNTGINCNYCPYLPADWQPTGNTRCVKDASNNNTGVQEREEKDMQSCSPTYLATRWISIGLNCTICPKPGNWQATGNYRCGRDASGNLNNTQEREEKDIEACSATYNQLRWVFNATKDPNWVETGNTRCLVGKDGLNTGYQEKEQVDQEPCSKTYGQPRWVDNGYNPSACPNIVYARMVMEVVYVGATYTYATPVIYFYSDAAGTIPANVTNLQVNYKIQKVYCDGYWPPYNQDVVTCSGTSYSLGSRQVSANDGAYECWDDRYELLPGTGYSILSSY